MSRTYNKKLSNTKLSRHKVLIIIGVTAFFVLFGVFIIFRSHAATKPHYSIIIVAGQSNADGAEAYVFDPTTNFDLFGAKAHPADTQTKLVWSNLAGNSGPPPVELKSIGDDATKYTKNQATFGPEIGLARGLYDQGRRNIIILKVTFGGMALVQDPAAVDWNVHSNNEAFTFLKNRLKTLNDWVVSQGGTSSVDGFYWVQGEADATPDKAPFYEANLRDLIAATHSELGLRADAPFVLAKTSLAAWVQTAQNLNKTNPCGKYDCSAILAADQKVRTAQQKAADSIANVKIVDTISLSRHGLNIHLSNVGELALGYAFAKASATFSAAALGQPPTPVQTPDATAAKKDNSASTRSSANTNSVTTIQNQNATSANSEGQQNGNVSSDNNHDTIVTSADGKTVMNSNQPNQQSLVGQIITGIQQGWDSMVNYILIGLGLR